MKKGCLWVLGIGFGLLLAGWLVLLILQHTVAAWPDPVPGVRLEPSRPFLAEADVKPDNAFYYMRQWKTVAVSAAVHEQNKAEYLRWRAYGSAGAPYPAIETALDANTDNLNLCRKAAEQPGCQVVTPVSYDHCYPEIGKADSLTTLLCYRAETAGSKGNWGAAACDLRTMLTLGSHFSRGGSLLQRLYSISMHGITTASIRRLALEQNAPPEFQKEMDAALGETARTLEPTADAVRYEWLFVNNYISDPMLLLRSASTPPNKTCSRIIWGAYRHGLLSPFGCSPAQTRHHLAGVYSPFVDAMEKGDRNALRHTADLDRFDIQAHPIRVLNDRWGGILMNLITPGVSKIFDISLRERADLDCTRLVLAVRRWQLEHGGKPPAALADLVPGCIPAIPEDPFSSKHEPLRYRTDGTGWAVYSVGDDGKDDGGHYSLLDKEDKTLHPNELDLVFGSDEFQKKRARYAELHPKK